MAIRLRNQYIKIIMVLLMALTAIVSFPMLAVYLDKFYIVNKIINCIQYFISIQFEQIKETIK